MTGIISKLNEMKMVTSVKSPHYDTIKDILNISNLTANNIKDAQEEVRLIMRGMEREDPHYMGLQYIQNMLNYAIEKIND